MLSLAAEAAAGFCFFVFFGNAAAAAAAQYYKFVQICAHSQVQSISCNLVRPTNLSSTHNPTLSCIDLNFSLCTLSSHLQKLSRTLTVNQPTLLLTSTLVIGLEEFVEHSEVLFFLNYLSSTLLWVLSRQ
jgi:hypothetical protein